MNQPRRHKYDNAVAPNNPYGHTLVLLDRHLSDDGRGGVHLDLACGFGHVAEPISQQFGLEYVGVDVDEDELEDLRARGFEAHALDLNDPSIGDRLRKVLDGRSLTSVSFLDGLEHLTSGQHVLAALGDLLAEHRAIAVVSVPNVTHLDVGMKAILGKWEYTESGLLDETHYCLYSGASLRGALRTAGLHPFDTFDVVMVESDQHFPADHVALAPTTPMSQWIRAVRDKAEPNGAVNQFVWALTAVPPRPRRESEQVDEPFLSVIMRTQGRRPQELREALLCLAGQSSSDFEVLLIAHKTTVEEQLTVERIIEDQPPYLRDRIRLLLLDRGGRAAPVNLGIENARGRYVGVFDDDDLVMGDWVAEFAALERQHGGKVLRAFSMKQPSEVVTVRGERGLTATGSPEAAYSREFSLTRHIVGNESPCLGWVFPRSLATDFGLRYDESMTTTEDWAFLLSAAELAGVTDVGRVTSIYRWWHEAEESSRTVHVAEEWLQNQAEIERRLDAEPFLLPAGETRLLRSELIELRQLRDQARQHTKLIGELQRSRGRLQKQLRASRRRNRRLQRRNGVPTDQAQARSVGGRPRTLRQRLALRTRLRRLLRRTAHG